MLTRVRAHEIAASGNGPIDIMNRNMLYWDHQAQVAEARLEAEVFDLHDDEDAEELERLKKHSHYARSMSQSCAVDLAPYVQARMASITVKGDPMSPLEFKVDTTLPLRVIAEAYGESLRQEKEAVS